ncbi:MAG TPA: tRNA (adenosine(37)-N6)-threonylcarbamoyltransferase complex dimerization subunit type 1 TsaB [Mycobacteriales bacterium]|jgi:tRNA threonylcarbamoyl adenosine modification protein YeaZ|nr:tRNA (adenosine(37)-N6)-threonylcarbamoyltransferase complex dimerization subunit type 1 TsaB [Mycobacteriales bacterium]
MLTLALETSTATFAAALATDDEVVAVRALEGVPPQQRDLPGLVAGLLAEAGRGFADLGRIAVDVGPGNLAAVRTGVAYGNGLAFALGIGVATADSLELMAAQAGPAVPVLCLRNAGAGRAYGGWFAGGTATYRHGPLAEVVALAGGPEVVLAGDFRTEAAELLPGVVVKDSGLTGPDVRVLRRVTAGRPTLDPTRERAASPLTDTSPRFGGSEVADDGGPEGTGTDD